jgi:hypothetical protein
MSFAKNYANKQLGVLQYKGTWDASSNNPVITSSFGDKGDYYIVSVAGTTAVDNLNDWQPGDWIVFSGENWQKLDNSDRVTSVNGQIGDVIIEQNIVGEVDGGQANTVYGGNIILMGGSA